MQMVIQRGKHRRGCRSLGGKRSPWVCPEAFWGNYAANVVALRGRHHNWLRFLCNDPECPARLFVRADHVARLVAATPEGRR